MQYTVFFLVCFTTSIIGAICGIGGGVIIKPVLDSLGVMDVTSISFLSGCTVLSMSTYSVVKGKICDKSKVEEKIAVSLGGGAAIGGLIGKGIFFWINNMSVQKVIKCFLKDV